MSIWWYIVGLVVAAIVGRIYGDVATKKHLKGTIDAGQFIITYGDMEADHIVRIDLSADLPEIENAKAVRLEVVINHKEND